MAIIQQEVAFGTEFLRLLRSKSGVEGGAAPASSLPKPTLIREVERAVFEHLAFLLSVSPFVIARQLLMRPDLLCSVFQLTGVGSPRIQRLAMNLLAISMPLTVPDAFVAAVNTAIPAGRQLVSDVLLSRAGRAFACNARRPATGLAMGTAAPVEQLSGPPVGAGAGQIQLATTATTVDLLRALVVAPAWRDAVMSDLVAALSACLGVLGVSASASGASSGGAMQEQSDHQQAAARAAAALCALGGNADVLRVGGAVSTIDQVGGGRGAGAVTRALMQQRGEGRVLAYHHGDASARVVFTTSAGILDVQDLDAAKLVAATTYPLQARAVVPSTSLLNILVTLATLGIPKASGAAGAGGGAGAGAGSGSGSGSGSGDGSSAHTLPPPNRVELWKAELRARALEAIQTLVVAPAWSKAILDNACLPQLFRAATQMVTLPSFVRLAELRRRASVLRQRLLEIGVGLSMASGVSGAADPEQGDKVAQIVELGFTPKVALLALAENNNKLPSTIDFLLSATPEFLENLEKKGESEGDGGERWGVANNMSQNLGLPPKLTYAALEMFNDDVNIASSWLFEIGREYVSEYAKSDAGKAGNIAATSSVRTDEVVVVCVCARFAV